MQGSKLNPLETLTPPLTADFAKSKSKKVDVDKALLKKVQSEELFHGKLELIEELAPIKQLEQPAASREKEQKVPARAPEEHVQGLRHGPLRPRAPEAQVQGLQPEELLPARAPEGALQRLRRGLLPARALEAQVQGMLNAATARPGTRSTLGRRTFDVALVRA